MAPRTGGRARNLLFASIATVLAAVVVLAVIEGGLRAYLAFKDWRFIQSQPPIADRVLIPSEDAALLYEFRPGIDRPDLRTNSFGMRNAELSLEKAPGVFRIAFVGDSVTASWGYVPREEIYLAVLENLLNAEGSPPARVESLNFGVNGYSMEQGLRVAETKVPAFDPDLVVVQLSLNDPYPSDSAYGRFAPGGFRLYTYALRLLDPDRHAGWYGISRYYDDAGWENIQYAMEGYARLQAQGVDVLLVLFPYLSRKAYDDWDFRALHDRFAAEAERLGLPFLDLYDAFDRNGLVADRLNLHPTSAGHAVAGSELAAELRRRGSWKKTDSSRKKPPTER